MNRIKVVLLPGMDGTGLLFKPLLDIIPNDINIEVIPLSQETDQSVESEVKRIEKIISDENIILFAESYSGRIAYELAKRSKISIKHIIFVASFLSTPSLLSSLLSKLAQYFPISILRKRIVPQNIINWLCFRSVNSTALINLLYESINSVDACILKARLANISCLLKPQQILSIETTYIQASHDLFISNHALTEIQQLFQSVDLQKVSGGHFIAQANPQACLTIITNIINKNNM
ncbi:MAG: hypothetical protein ACRBCI_09040 [Cellvibrionaceae bacterium]